MTTAKTETPSIPAPIPAQENTASSIVRDDLKDIKEIKQAILAKHEDNRVVTEDVSKTNETWFEDFFLRRELLLGIYEKGFERCSPVQEATIPFALAGNDLLARAKNGTGKTAAYAVPILNRIEIHNTNIQALVLAPARELAMQTSNVFRDLAKFMEESSTDDAGNVVTSRVNCMVTTGGTSLRDDILRLEHAVHVVVATLGRIDDLAGKGIADLKECKMMVLDEADKLLSNEWTSTVEKIMSYTHPQRQVMLFSATFPQSVEVFKKKHIPDAKEVNLMSELTLKGITQYYAYVEERQKLHCLNTLFMKLNISQCIIFCNSVRRVELLSEKITALGFPCFYIHSGMLQSDRNKVFHDFRQGNIKCLVSSDLFSRGIDVKDVNVVINFDFPRNSETYLHRIGRSGRYGHLGLAVNLVCFEDRVALYRVEQELGTTIEAIPSAVDENLYT
eukprot:GHVH01000991.1.p1 GENE.GHVH01000991.1~~GHVH01000991.1.p1  ORF type:complete len:448 (+),score=48.68 GHVH01000991.1:256-1599(+)